MLVSNIIEYFSNNNLTANHLNNVVDELQKNTLLRYLGEFGYLPANFKKQWDQYLNERTQFDHNDKTDVHEHIFFNKRKVITEKLKRIFDTNMRDRDALIEEVKTFTKDHKMIEYLSFVNEQVHGGNTELQITLSLQYYLEKSQSPKDVLMPLSDAMTALVEGEIYEGKTYNCMPGLAERLIDRVGALMDSQTVEYDDAYRNYAQSVLHNFVSGEGKTVLISALWYALDLPELTWTTTSVTKKMLFFKNQDICSLSKDEYTKAEQYLIKLLEQDARNHPNIRTYSREFLVRHMKPVDEISKTFDHDSVFSYKDIDMDMLKPSHTDIDTVLVDACQNYNEKNKEDLLNEICTNIKLDINQLHLVLLGVTEGLDGLFREMYEIQCAEKSDKVISKTDLESRACAYFEDRKVKSRKVYHYWLQNNFGSRLYIHEHQLEQHDLISSLQYISEELVLAHIHDNDVLDILSILIIKSVLCGYCTVTNHLLGFGQIDLNMSFDVDIDHGRDETLLTLASLMGHVDIVSALLDQSSIDINKANSTGDTALIAVSHRGNKDIARLLLRHPKIEINKVDDKENTALLIAAARGHAEIVSMLLDKPLININRADHYGYTALMGAADQGHVDIVKQLLQHSKIEINNVDNTGNTALIAAAYRGHNEIVSTLLKQPHIDINKCVYKNSTALFAAAHEGHDEIVCMLLNEPAIEVNKENNWGDSALWAAISQGHADTVDKLLRHPHIDINKINRKGTSPLIMAILCHHTKIISMLLEHSRIEVNKATQCGNTALFVAVREDYIDIVCMLLEHPNIDINSSVHYGRTPLTQAVYKGYVDIVNKFLKHDQIDINDNNIVGTTPLHIAAREGHKEIVDLLLGQSNIDVNKVNDNGETALINAVCGGHEDIVRQLLKRPKINVNFVDYNGNTALFEAAYCGYKEIVSMLLEKPDIDVNKADEWGKTALMMAISEDHMRTVEKLLKHPLIDTNKTDEKGTTPMLIASLCNREEAVSMLLDHENRKEVKQDDNSAKLRSDYYYENANVMFQYLTQKVQTLFYRCFIHDSTHIDVRVTPEARGNTAATPSDQVISTKENDENHASVCRLYQ